MFLPHDHIWVTLKIIQFDLLTGLFVELFYFGIMHILLLMILRDFCPVNLFFVRDLIDYSVN